MTRADRTARDPSTSRRGKVPKVGLYRGAYKPMTHPGTLDRRVQKSQHRRMSHPDPNGPPDLIPIQIGEVQENPARGERATIRAPIEEPGGLAAAELTALVGARVVGGYRHPAMVERFATRA
jgi:hypothetical protein